jgi:hypothetical protein
MRYAAIFTATALLLGVSAMSAQACNPLLDKNHGKHVAPRSLPASMLAKNNPNIPTRPSIVGLWHVTHTDTEGNLIFESYDMWHSDGTEEEMVNGPPAGGPVCFGVWTQSGNSIHLLTHVAFLYDLSNNFVGTLNLTETNRVARDGNRYKGTIDIKIYDPNGNLAQETLGTTKADRLNGG